MFAHVSGGVIGASEVFNGETRELTVQIDATDVLRANSAGIQSASFKYFNPVAGAVTVAGDVFHSAMGTPFLASVFSGGAYITDANAAVPMVAPITRFSMCLLTAGKSKCRSTICAANVLTLQTAVDP